MPEENDIDVKENYIKQLDKNLLSVLLKDRSSGKNIIWATDIYASKGSGYQSYDYMSIDAVTGRFGQVIRPRTNKSKKEQQIRVKDKAEVFTPSWICNEMANHLDEEYFGRENVFNVENGNSWTTNKEKIDFSKTDKTWQDYVKQRVLEITCGEAPFLTSRYDTVSGDWIEPNERIGVLDRKLRIVNENTSTKEDWLTWVFEAYKATFGYEWQGDSLLIARENLLFTFIDYYIEKFAEQPSNELLTELAEILSWNIWQMDGLKFVIPNSCKPIPKMQMSLFDDEEQFEECPSCAKGNNNKHTGIYCKVMNWDTHRSIKFYKGDKKMKFDFIIGNPPYQENIADRSEQPPVYHLFYDAAFSVSDRVELITPARFLFNAGKTPKVWNNKILADNHFKVLKYLENSKDIFPSVEIKGGVAITYRNESKDFGAIGIFLKNETMEPILKKVRDNTNVFINTIFYSNTSYKYTNKLRTEHPNFFEEDENGEIALSGGSARYLASSAFEKLSSIFYSAKPNDTHQYIKILGRKENHRVEQYIDKDYINPPDNFMNYKVFISSSNGTGEFGEILTTPFVAAPNVGATETFVSIGNFKNEKHAQNLVKYLKTKAARALLGTLKVTQGNKNSDVWSNVPLQDFTENSDIDWTKSVHEIDLQLYEKYGLDDNEIAFIESHVKEMK